jgi:hypothetical protein
MARQPELKYKIHSYSLKEIHQAIEVERTVLPDDIEFLGRKVFKGSLVVAYVLWCLTRPEPERQQIHRQMIMLYERLCASDTPCDIEAEYAAMLKELGIGNPRSIPLGSASFQKTLPVAGQHDVGRLNGNQPARSRKPEQPPIAKVRVRRK